MNRNQLQSQKIRKNDAGITSQNIADKLGIALAVVVGWEDGSIKIDADTAGKYRDAVIALGG